jgi:uncharacterized protein (DUF885 family)
MRIHKGFLFATVVVAVAGVSLYAQKSDSVAERVAAQNVIFEEQYESDLRNFPERATAYGDYRYNDKLADYSLAAIAARHKTDEEFLAKLAAVPYRGFRPERI